MEITEVVLFWVVSKVGLSPCQRMSKPSVFGSRDALETLQNLRPTSDMVQMVIPAIQPIHLV